MRTSLPIFLASTLLAAATASGAHEPPRISVGPTGQELKVGVVDIDKALGGYVRVKEAEKEIGRRFGASERKLKKRDRALAERENGLKLSPLNPDSDKYREDMKKLREDRESHRADWKQYVINLEGKDLSSISGGFAWATNLDVNPDGATFYLDDIRYE